MQLVVTYETSRGERQQTIATSTVYLEGMGWIPSLSSAPPAHVAIRIGAHVLECIIDASSVVECLLGERLPSLRFDLNAHPPVPGT